MPGRLDGKVAIVIGGAKGVGSGVVEVFAREGARVVLADIDDKAGAAMAARHGATYVHADTAWKPDMQALAARTVDRFGRIDVLAHIAGICPRGPIETLDETDWDRTLAVNLKGAFLAVQACFPTMRRQSYGRIVFTGSITGPHVTWPDHGHYASSKAGLVGLARSVALEGAPFGITCNVVEPGNVETETVRATHGEGHLRTMAAAVPIGRLAQPVDVGESMAFLCSDAAAYVTGTTLVLDGGQILPEARMG